MRSTGGAVASIGASKPIAELHRGKSGRDPFHFLQRRRNVVRMDKVSQWSARQFLRCRPKDALKGGVHTLQSAVCAGDAKHLRREIEEFLKVALGHRLLPTSASGHPVWGDILLSP